METERRGLVENIGESPRKAKSLSHWIERFLKYWVPNYLYGRCVQGKWMRFFFLLVLSGIHYRLILGFLVENKIRTFGGDKYPAVIY